jgi:hypothetical protein
MKRIFRALLNGLPRNRLGDRIHHLAYFFVAHRRLPRRSSGLFNDYLFFLKASGGLEDVLRQFTSDKALAKLWIESRLGEGFTPRTLAILEPSEVTATNVPGNCVAKPTHLCGTVAFLSSEPVNTDLEALRASGHRNLYEVSREANYKNLRPRVIFEEMVDLPTNMVDYKLFCFDGEPRIIQVDVARHSKHRRSLYTAGWDRIDITYSKPKGPSIEPPACLEKMLKVARELAGDFESVRVDLYVADDRIFVGELTHCPEQAHGRFGSIEEERLFSQIYFSEAGG